MGISPGSGHFVADIWSPDNGLWFSMNDSVARPTTPESVASEIGYMFFYKRRSESINHSVKDIRPSSPSRTSSPPLLTSSEAQFTSSPIQRTKTKQLNSMVNKCIIN